MNKKLLEQLALAKEAGTKSMAKEFFAPVPGSSPAEGGSVDAEQAAMPDAAAQGGEGGADDLSPEQLEELLRMLESQGGGGVQ